MQGCNGSLRLHSSTWAAGAGPGFGYSTFSKVQKKFWPPLCTVGPLVSLRDQLSPTAPLQFASVSRKQKRKQPHERGKWNRDSWGWGHGVGAGWGRDWAIAAVPRGDEVDYLSTRGNIRL